jgi:signal transduction histidine kinase/CheY-like chemotaxis protein
MDDAVGDLVVAPRVVRALERAAWFGALFVAAVGVIALVGWALDVDAMRAIHPAVGAIKVNAAISFVLVGVALGLALRTKPPSHVRASRTLSSVVSVLGALTLLEYVPGADFGIDDVLFADEATLFAPGRMSPISAAAFLAIGLALICLDARGRAGPITAQVLALGAGFVSLLALLGNVYGVRALYTLGGYEEVALNPAVALTVCSASILCARPARGVMAVVASEGPGGALARRLLPAAILVPAAIGALVILGEQTALFDVEHETALFAATSIVCFTALTWWTASRFQRIDVARRRAERTAAETKRKADEQLVRSQRLESVGRLAGGIAHDFNNLLTVIITYGHLLQRRAEDPKLGEMVRAAQRAGELTRQLLALSRRQVLQPSVLDLGELLDTMSDMLRRAIGEDVELAITKRAPIAPIYVDAGQIEQVILNLVVNARDAMPQGGRIAITLETVEAHVRLTVRDSGVGMDAATLAQIFEPYFTTKDEAKGTGLGLPTALGIVEQSGGTIRVTSEPGDGTTFEVQLPVHARSETDPERLPAEASAAPPAAPVTETVLLVEDDDQVRKIIGTVLREHGYTVIEAPTPGDALLIAEQQPAIDLLLTDVVMPRMGGRQLAERIHQLVPAARVLFMSGHTDDAILRHGIESSVVAFIEKPIEPAALLAKLREILDG